jgi:hypothetical protein
VKLAALFALFALLPQQPAPPATGRIEGQVLRVDSMEPVSGARVRVLRVNPNTGVAIQTSGASGGGGIGGNNAPLPPLPGADPRFGPAPSPGPLPPPPIAPVTTGRDGKFVIPGLAEGSYRVAVDSNGYVPQEYGQRTSSRISGQGIPLKLSAGEVLRDLVIRMTPTATISGRVTDANGQPAVRVPVQLVSTGYSLSGQRTLQINSAGETDDRGEYRIFWITPGHYYIAAGTPVGRSIPLPSDAYVFTYYPGTTDTNRALEIDVKAGSQSAFDFVVQKQRSYSIRGRVVDAASRPPSAIGLNLAFSTFGGGGGSAYLNYGQSYDPATGTLEFRDIPVSTYVVQANAGAATGRAVVEVINADIEGLTVIVGTGVGIAGQVRFDSGGAPPAGQTRIQLRPTVTGMSNFPGFSPQTQTDANGAFKIDGVLSGEYRAVITAPADYFVKEARFDRGDALNRSIEVADSHAGAYTFDIVISPNVGQIDGVVTNEQLQPVPGARAVLVPDKRDRIDLFTVITTDQSGGFTMRRIVPGDYKLFAWEAIENNGYFDPDVLKRAESSGTVIHVDESAKLNVQVKVIPAEK